MAKRTINRSLAVAAIPNSLTLLRVIFALVFPMVHATWRLPLIVASLLTEFLDGQLARRLNAVTRFGQIFDPVADKLFVLSVAATLLYDGLLTPVQLVLIGCRDLTVAAGVLVLLLLRRPLRISRLQPRVSGKMTTALQFFFLLSLLTLPALSPPLFLLTVLSSTISAVDYVVSYTQRTPNGERTPSF